MARRGNGEGSVYQRLDGLWVAAYRKPNGRRGWFYGKTRKEVADKLQQAQAALNEGTPVPVGNRETVARFLERWLRDVAPHRVRDTTLADYRGDIRRHILPALGRLRLQELTPARVQRFINELSAQGLGPDTVQHVRAVLRVALGQAQREGILGQNPAKLVEVPKVKREEVPALRPIDAKALLDAFTGHDYEALVTLTLATGLRQGEVLGLAWDDIDFEARTLTVRRQVQRVDGAYRLTALKTSRSRRTLALPPLAVEALRQQRVRQAEARLRAGPAWIETGRIFTTVRGDYLNGSTVTHRFQQRLAEVGLDARKFHHLRHGAASLLLAQGASMRVVMEQLGHSLIALTMNTYAHIAPQLLRDAADKLEAALGGN